MNLRYRFLIVFVLLAGMGLYMRSHKDLEVPIAKPFEEFPASHAGWRMVGQSNLSTSVMAMLKPSDYLSRSYMAEDGSTVDMYLSFLNGGSSSGAIDSPKNCMPSSGWFEISSERTTRELGGETVKLVRAVYAMGEQRELIYYWFDMRGQTMSDEYSLKLAEITGSMFHSRRDQSFIRISVQARENVEAAQKRVEDFLRDFYPVIREFLPG